MSKNSFFESRIKTPYQQFLIFLSFMNAFSKAAVCKCSSKYVLLKLGTLTMFRIKKRVKHRCFPVNIAKFLRTGFL